MLDASLERGRVLLRMLRGDGGGLEDIYVDARYRGYIDPRIDAEKLLAKIEEHPSIEKAWVEEWLQPPYYRSWRKIVVFEVRDPRDINEIHSRVEELGLGARVNTYPGLIQSTLKRLGIPVLTRLRGDLGVDEDIKDPLYQSPPIRWAWVRLLAWYGEALSKNSRVVGFEIESPEGVSRGSIDRFFEAIEDLDPHMILYRGPFEEVIDRIARSTGSISVYMEGVPIGFYGLVEWSRISYTIPRIAGRYSIGRVLTSIEALRAFEKRYIVPHRAAGYAEAMRSVASLPLFDRGGYVMKPEPGIYFGVVQIDFSSLYPSIISRYNISPETVNDPFCSNYIEVPEAMHRICVERRGLVAEVLGDLVARRQEIKRALEDAPPHLRRILGERQEAIKWILVASFGYLGYRNARFGRIDSYECVTAYARETAWRAIDAVRSTGYRVIHYIVDSAFIEIGRVDQEEAVEIARTIERATGFRARVEAIYRWLIIPPTARGYGASNRYIGKLLDDSMKIKGVEPVRRDTPPIVKKAWIKAIDILSKADTEEELRQKAIEALDELKNIEKTILNGSAPPEELVITRTRGDEDIQIIRHRRFYPATSKRGYSPRYYLERLEGLKKLLLYIIQSTPNHQT
ncbi:MAG: DNA polymerase domain-containing protein [Sulfolobales archaeon]